MAISAFRTALMDVGLCRGRYGIEEFLQTKTLNLPAKAIEAYMKAKL